MTERVYCPKCSSKKPMMKAGRQYRFNTDKVVQLWKCRSKPCSYVTVKPLKSKR